MPRWEVLKLSGFDPEWPGRFEMPIDTPGLSWIFNMLEEKTAEDEEPEDREFFEELRYIRSLGRDGPPPQPARRGEIQAPIPLFSAGAAASVK